MIATDKIETALQTARPRQLQELTDWLRIPSISTLASHRQDVEQAASWLAGNLQQAGLENVELLETPHHPLVYADWLHAGADRPTVLIYGHYDVQPVDPLHLWYSDPFEPTVRPGAHGDELFARGAADDKGQIFVHVKAVEALLQHYGRLPVNVKFLVEGEEEIGSHSLDAFVPAQTAKLAASVGLISDTSILSPSQPTLIYGLRGLWTGQITVRGAASDLHSGSFGGAVHGAAQALAELIARLHDTQGRVTVPGFYANVAPLSTQERAELAKIPYDESHLLARTKAPAAYGDPDYSVLERIGARPTLEVNGIWGGFTGDGFKTVLPALARAKISCRLVANQDPARITDLIGDYLRQIAPPTVQVELESYQSNAPALVQIDVPEMQAAARAYARGFGALPLFNREGGSIPVVSMFQRHLQIPVILMGFGLPDDNLHAPNEKFNLNNFYRGIQTSVAFLEELTR